MTTRPDTIDPEIADELAAEDKVQFLDARPPRKLAEGAERIPGAVSVDASAGTQLDEILTSLPRTRLFVAYCDEPGNAASAKVARRVRELTLGDASVLAGGLAAWKEAGFATEPITPPAPAGGLATNMPANRRVEMARLVRWLDLAPDADADDEQLLAALPREEFERLRGFLELAAEIPVPDDHATRIANLPPALAATIAADDEDGAILLLRYLTWSGVIPRRQAWWYAPEVEPPGP